MPFCPECGDEYREGWSTCTDCGVPLAEGSPPSPPTETGGGSHGGYDQVAETTDLLAAELIALKLRSAGIEAQVVDQTFHQEPVPVVRALSVVRVLAPSARVAEAQALLAQGEALPEDASDTMEGDEAAEPTDPQPRER